MSKDGGMRNRIFCKCDQLIPKSFLFFCASMVCPYPFGRTSHHRISHHPPIGHQSGRQCTNVVSILGPYRSQFLSLPLAFSLLLDKRLYILKKIMIIFIF
ncbi:hypothetical protein AQUCO_00500302v1 [Aquilegia coerulea]|uniref:Uncharacterized protein n=1 Tax=Aquilegia coerulea TaxID=218851 RepID=A0A2G5ERA4_AQUCA|nr:hypothetical protein AQUCO_00500302v1 [Aquilegia coerulea]